MSLDIRYKCNICGNIYTEGKDIAQSYIKEVHKQYITKANGHINANIHICRYCEDAIKTNK